MSIAKNNVDYLNDIKSWDTFSTQSVATKLKEYVSVHDFLTPAEIASTRACPSSWTAADLLARTYATSPSPAPPLHAAAGEVEVGYVVDMAADCDGKTPKTGAEIIP